MKRDLDHEVTRPVYERNETEANRQMCYVCLFCAGALTLALILYAFKLFPLHNYTQVYIVLPILIVVLVSSFFWSRTKFITKPGFKYFVISTILLVIALLSTLLPRHFALSFALLIILSNHYYSPRFSRFVFIITVAAMLLAIYAGMLVGEYDPNLLTEGKVVLDEATGEYVIYQPESPRERIAFINELIAQGKTNRWVTAAVYYFFSRAIILTLIYLVSNALSYRTHNLLEKEALGQRDKARIATELSVAEEIQRTVLPSASFQNEKVEILAQLKPARAVGGDFYDYWFPDAYHVAFLIGDVSGKGIPAAMFMMKTLASFRASYSLGLAPSEVMKKVNSLLCAGNDASMFVTTFFGVLDVRTGKVEFANGGHNAPILCEKGNFRYLNCKKGMILGALEDLLIEDEEIALPKGAGFLLYTDGITEARNAQGEFYGENRLLDFVSKATYQSLVEFGHDLEDNIIEFVGEAEQSDDITYICWFYESELVHCREKSFPATMDSMKEVQKFVIEQARKAKIDEKGYNIFVIAMDEIFSNIVKYGQVPADSEVHIRCVYRPQRKVATITIVDRGVPFDPTKFEATLMDEREEPTPGGLGWHMVKSMMDELVYHRTNGKNVVSISKKV